MSALNGDRSRFHRDRKHKIARRKRTRELVMQAQAQRKSADSPGVAKPPKVSV